jgi:SAM-dependent methyltransferase
LRLYAACGKHAARDLKKLAKSHRRTPDASRREYEQRWQRQARDRRWMAAPTLAEAQALSSYGDETLTALIDFRPYAIGARDFFRWRSRKIVAIFSALFERSKPIVEIGCGLGKNLFALASGGFSNLSGFDVSPTAVAAVRDQAQHFGVAIEAARLDVLAPDSETVAGFSDAVIFTNHVLEQLPRDLEAALDALCACDASEVVHLEPCFELLRPTRSMIDAVTALHTVACDYQRTLLSALKRRERRGAIRLLDVRPLGYSPRLINAPTLIRWRKL